MSLSHLEVPENKEEFKTEITTMLRGGLKGQRSQQKAFSTAIVTIRAVKLRK